ncbi:MAG: hypothetical protein LC135_01855 [Phycisphaerae bacterium]|nr:major capsid protein [Phycisphaerae bacterium]MCZ2398598.1 hypothetical protein [Phycisphaerae bacterium]
MEVLILIVGAALLLAMASPAMAVDATHAVGRADLVGAFEEAVLDEGQYVGEQVFPVVPVSRKKAFFPAITRESLLQHPDTLARGMDATYRRLIFQTEDRAYACEERGGEILLDDGQVAELATDYGLEPDEVAGRLLYHQVRRQHEAAVAAQVFDPVANFTAGQGNYTDVTGSEPWTDPDALIVPTILAAIEAIAGRTGAEPAAMVMNRTNFHRLMNNAQIRAGLAADRTKTVRELASAIAPLLGLEQIYVGQAVYNAAPLGGAFSGAKFWSNLYVNVFVRGDGLTRPTLGVTTLYSEDSAQNVVLEEYRDDTRRSQVMRARHVVDEVVCDVAFGQLIKVAAA